MVLARHLSWVVDASQGCGYLKMTFWHTRVTVGKRPQLPPTILSKECLSDIHNMAADFPESRTLEKEKIVVCFVTHA